MRNLSVILTSLETMNEIWAACIDTAVEELFADRIARGWR
jgi:hypothetical protein